MNQQKIVKTQGEIIKIIRTEITSFRVILETCQSIGRTLNDVFEKAPNQKLQNATKKHRKRTIRELQLTEVIASLKICRNFFRIDTPQYRTTPDLEKLDFIIKIYDDVMDMLASFPTNHELDVLESALNNEHNNLNSRILEVYRRIPKDGNSNMELLHELRKQRSKPETLKQPGSIILEEVPVKRSVKPRKGAGDLLPVENEIQAHEISLFAQALYNMMIARTSVQECILLLKRQDESQYYNVKQDLCSLLESEYQLSTEIQDTNYSEFIFGLLQALYQCDCQIKVPPVETVKRIGR